MEKPFVPFYKPYGMTDEEYEYEVRIAEDKYREWESDQAQEALEAEYQEYLNNKKSVLLNLD